MSLSEERRQELMEQVLRLTRVDGLSERAIARKLKIGRETVRGFLGKTVRTPRGPHPRASILDPYVPTLRQLVEETPTLHAPAALERLRKLGYDGGISIVRERLTTLRPRAPREAFLTLTFKPGEAAQVDWADFGFAIPGCPRRVSAFVMALCHSRYLYLEFTLSQSLPSLLRCMERGLRFFGGATHVDIFDNMKTVVLSHTPLATVFNPSFMAYAEARDFRVRACNVYRGNEKGRVERPIGFIRERFWPGRHPADLFDLNSQAAQWRDDVANHRIHDVTGKVPSLVFEHEEKAHLRPLSPTPFETDEKLSCQVTKTYRVRFDRNTYSVPWKLVGQTVLVRANEQVVTLFLGPKAVARHARCWDAGKDIADPAHQVGLLEQKPRGAAERLPPSLASLGLAGEQYFKIFSANGRSLLKEIQRLTLLVELFSESAVRTAVEEVMGTGHVGSEYVEYVLRHKRGLVPSAAPLSLGDPALDGITLPEADLSLYDRLPQKTLDPEAP